MSENSLAAEAADQTGADQAKKPAINVPQLVDLAGGVLGRLLIAAPKEKSKQLFKELKKGAQVPLGELTFSEEITADFNLALDYSEFVGPGFNFDLFQTSLKQLLTRIGSHFKAKKDLNFRTSEQGGILIGVTGAIQFDEQVNVLMMSLEMGTPGEIGVRLMYMDPTQFTAAE